MILPAKHLSSDRALITLGAELLGHLERPRTVSSLWNTAQKVHKTKQLEWVLTFDWFVLALDLLFAMGVLELVRGKLTRVQASEVAA